MDLCASYQKAVSSERSTFQIGYLHSVSLPTRQKGDTQGVGHPKEAHLPWRKDSATDTRCASPPLQIDHSSAPLRTARFSGSGSATFRGSFGWAGHTPDGPNTHADHTIRHDKPDLVSLTAFTGSLLTLVTFLLLVLFNLTARSSR